jgi:hypothetical protein
LVVVVQVEQLQAVHLAVVVVAEYSNRALVSRRTLLWQ